MSLIKEFMENKNTDPFEHIQVELKDGRKISWPIGDFTRLCPAAVCQIAPAIRQSLPAAADERNLYFPPYVKAGFCILPTSIRRRNL